MLLVWRVGERFEPGYGAAAAVVLGLGTMLLPFSTLLFSHVFSAMLGFAAFALCSRERDGPAARPLLLGAAGLLIGYAITSEYPLAFVAVVLGLYLLSRARRADAAPASRRAPAPTCSAASIGIVPLLLYNHAAFDSWTHLAYSEHPAAAERLLRHPRAEPAGARDAAVRLARAADALARAGHGRRRHLAALPRAAAAPRR